jgi:hypothetical protein
MRLTALLTTAVLGTSSLAIAQPWTEHHGQYYNDRVPRHQWMMLAKHVHIEGDGNVRVDLNGARVRSIVLQATRGGADIRQIGIQYSDGSHGVVRVDRVLDARRASQVRFDVGRDGMRGIEAIVVYGAGNAAFRVIGG